MTQGSAPGEVDIGEFVRILWRRRWIVAAAIGLGAAVGVTYAFTARQWFQSEVVLLPADAKSVSGGLAQLGGLASIAGVNLPTSGGGQAPLAVLRSRDFAREFIQSNNLIPILFADRWDSRAGSWDEKDGREPPDMRDAVQYYDTVIRSVSEDKKTGLVTLSILWTDPQVGANWANAMVQALNAKLRNQAEAEAEKNIKYLQAAIAETLVPALQQSISKVLESEMQKALIARGNDEYAFKVIDPATAPKQRALPKRKLIVAGAALLGAFLSAVLVVMVDRRSDHRVQARSA